METLIKDYFGKKINYRFYSWYKKCIDKLVCNGRGAANLCRFINGKCLINANIANKRDILFIGKFCNDNNIPIEFVEVDFFKNDL